MKKTIDEYMKKPYKMEIVKDTDVPLLRDGMDFIITRLPLSKENTIQSDEAKFEYIFTKLNQESLTLEEINNESKNVFNYEISSNLISKYLKDNSYIFNFQEEYPYCFKLKKIKKVSDKTYLNLDIIEFNEEKCSQDNLNYDSIREGVLILKNTEDKYYIELFALIKKEG